MLETGNERMYRAEASPTEVQLWSVFRRHALAMKWASEDERNEAERAGRDLVIKDDEGHAIATVSAEELAVMRESEARVLGGPPTVAQKGPIAPTIASASATTERCRGWGGQETPIQCRRIEGGDMANDFRIWEIDDSSKAASP